ncbi:MAG: OsmC family protein [Anaerolineales bacterium]
MSEEKKIINGIDVDAFQEALQIVGANPGASHAPKASRVRWMEGLKFKAFVRNHSFIVDEPAHLTGEDTSPNSVEYVLGAYGACLATGFVMNASKRGIAIRNLEVSLESTQDNVFTFLGLAPPTEGHPGFDEIKAKLYVQADADEAAVREIWEHTIQTSPVHNILTRSATIKPEVDVIP